MHQWIELRRTSAIAEKLSDEPTNNNGENNDHLEGGLTYQMVWHCSYLVLIDCAARQHQIYSQIQNSAIVPSMCVCVCVYRFWCQLATYIREKLFLSSFVID